MSRLTSAPRSLRAVGLRWPEKREKVTPVMQAGRPEHSGALYRFIVVLL